MLASVSVKTSTVITAIARDPKWAWAKPDAHLQPVKDAQEALTDAVTADPAIGRFVSEDVMSLKKKTEAHLFESQLKHFTQVVDPLVKKLNSECTLLLVQHESRMKVLADSVTV
jgi:hypothetical protein